MLTLITPTRNRNHCFKLLESYVANQTYKGQLQWVVVCDGGIEDYRFTMGQTVVSRDASNDPPHMASVCLNYLAALPHVQGDKIACVEDDDVYMPGYLDALDKALDLAPLAGSCPAKYYNLDTCQYKLLGNYDYASLAQTGFTREVLPTFERGLKMGDPFIDGWLWCHWAQTERKPYCLVPNDNLHVAMKGAWFPGLQPGVQGYGCGHAPRIGKVDWDGSILKNWLGDYWHNYA